MNRHLAALFLGSFVATSIAVAVARHSLAERAEPVAQAPTRPGLDLDAAIALPADAAEKLHSDDHAARLEAIEQLVAEALHRWPADHRRDFLQRIAPSALEIGPEACVPPSLLIAQAILESGWGQSQLATRGNNLFGIVAGSGQESITLPTTVEAAAAEGQTTGETTGETTVESDLEVEPLTKVPVRYRRFANWHDSAHAYGTLIGSDPRYAAAQVVWTDWEAALRALAPVYAADPNYVGRVRSLVRSYDLDEWDQLAASVAEGRDEPCLTAAETGRSG